MSTASTNFKFPAELRKRILFTLGVLAIYRIGVSVPTPGVDRNAVMGFFQAQSGSIFGLLNTFTGGALEQFSVFALGIMPYISASIIFQLLQTAIPYFEQLKKEGEQGRKKLNQYTRFGTVGLAAIQGYALAQFLINSNSNGQSLVSTPSFGPIPFTLLTVITLIAGTMFVMWLGERITERGIGNGASLIIFAGIAAQFPKDAAAFYKMVSSGEMSGLVALLIIAAMIAIVSAIIFVEVGQRRIPIQYSQRGGSRMGGQQQSHLPLKVNFANVIPPIFASSLLMFPATMTRFVDVPWLRTLQDQFSQTGPLYNLLFISLVVFFCFFYTEIVFDPKEVAENLKKYGGFIPGIRAGQTTAEYIKRVLDRLTVGGAIYLSLICIMPVIAADTLALPFVFGGTSILIVVGVALDTSQQIQSHLITAKYEGIMKGVKIKSRRVQY